MQVGLVFARIQCRRQRLAQFHVRHFLCRLLGGVGYCVKDAVLAHHALLIVQMQAAGYIRATAPASGGMNGADLSHQTESSLCGGQGGPEAGDYNMRRYQFGHSPWHCRPESGTTPVSGSTNTHYQA